MAARSRAAQRYIVVEGPIGVGKTSLARRLAADSRGASWCSSRTRRIRSSSASTATPTSGALPAQLFFLFQRAQQLGALKQQDLFAPRRVADYLFEKDRLFARLTLDDAETALYEQVASRLDVDPPKPDLVVYLQAPVEMLLERIAKRGIAYEQHHRRAVSRRGSTTPTRASSTSSTRAPLLIVNAATIDPVQNQARLRRAGGGDPAHEAGAHVLQPAAQPRYLATLAAHVHTPDNAIPPGRRSRWARSRG